VNDKRLNEYELSFSYFERYIKLIDDPEFATKVYVYSKKHNTPHYHIFDVIRKGVTYNYQKNRVFDDIFKIICQGRYVFNITNEKQIDRQLKTIGRPVKTRPQIKNHEKTISSVQTQAQRPAGQEKRRPHVEKQRKNAPVKRKKASAATVPRYIKGTALRTTHTIAEMIHDLSRDKQTAKYLHGEFVNRLPSELTKSLGFQNNTSLNDDLKMKQLRELIHYVHHNYESILSEEKMFPAHKQKIESLGFPLHTIFTVILNCFNTLKSEFLTGGLKQKKNRSLFKRFKLF
jgi:hypothetical protein